MISNENLINAFLNGETAENGSMSTNGTKLFSYATCIAQRVDDKILLNVCKYSVTTSKQQTMLRRRIEHRGMSHRVVEVGTDKYIYRGASELTAHMRKAA